MFENSPLIAIPCQIRPGAFSGERVFSVELANGDWYEGVAPRQFLWNIAKKLVGDGEPAASKTADGYLAAHLIRRADDQTAVVEVPDGEHLAISSAKIEPRPSPITPPVRTSSELSPHVPV